MHKYGIRFGDGTCMISLPQADKTDRLSDEFPSKEEQTGRLDC